MAWKQADNQAKESHSKGNYTTTGQVLRNKDLLRVVRRQIAHWVAHITYDGKHRKIYIFAIIDGVPGDHPVEGQKDKTLAE
jgi:hypothetical protein